MILGQEQQDRIRTADCSLLIHDADTVAVPVECDTDVRFLLEDCSGKVRERLVLAGISQVVGERSIRLAEELRKGATALPEDGVVHGTAHAIAVIDNNLQSLQGVEELCEFLCVGSDRIVRFA
ncbi:hypothetical protein COU80_04350 [Candidatus Peregrinibacteria bacterium CG10_big_fil_rev_8_21_14_0_10_55_24]|nr:MAG: hypothetical protein COU80_04350 [Candidatus Peregrinibacteria bacterium CG10_big_fil_rev_8_21_14_0_10_55_24]